MFTINADALPRAGGLIFFAIRSSIRANLLLVKLHSLSRGKKIPARNCFVSLIIATGLGAISTVACAAASQAAKINIPLPQSDYVTEVRAGVSANTYMLTTMKHKDGRFLKRFSIIRNGTQVSQSVTLINMRTKQVIVASKADPLTLGELGEVAYPYMIVKSVTQEIIAGEPCTRYESTFEIDRYIQDQKLKTPDETSPRHAYEKYKALKAGQTVFTCVTKDGIRLGMGEMGKYSWQVTGVERRPVSEAEMTLRVVAPVTPSTRKP